MNGDKQRLEEEVRRLHDEMARDKNALLAEGSRLSGLVDHLQDEIRDVVPPLPIAEPSRSPLGSATGELVEETIHRLVTMGVFTP